MTCFPPTFFSGPPVPFAFWLLLLISSFACSIPPASFSYQHPALASPYSSALTIFFCVVRPLRWLYLPSSFPCTKPPFSWVLLRTSPSSFSPLPPYASTHSFSPTFPFKFPLAFLYASPAAPSATYPSPPSFLSTLLIFASSTPTSNASISGPYSTLLIVRYFAILLLIQLIIPLTSFLSSGGAKLTKRIFIWSSNRIEFGKEWDVLLLEQQSQSKAKLNETLDFGL